MTTSGTYNFSVSRDDIIRQALLNIGKLDPFEVPDSQQTTDCAMVLNMMAKQWQGTNDFGTGLRIWTRKRGFLFLSASTGTYELGSEGDGWTLSYTETTTTAVAAAAAVTVDLTSVTGLTVGDHIGFWQTDSSIFWTTVSAINTLTVTVGALPVGVASGAAVYFYTTPAPQPVNLEAVVLRDSNDNDTPIRIIRTTQDYDILPNKAQVSYQSDPTAVYLETQVTSSLLYTDCGSAADLTKKLVLTYMTPVQDFNNPLDTPYYPAEYFLALCWGLSKLICPQFNRVWTKTMEDNYVMSVGVGKNKDAEVSTLYFQPGEE
jgi:hypothetical protein